MTRELYGKRLKSHVVAWIISLFWFVVLVALLKTYFEHFLHAGPGPSALGANYILAPMAIGCVGYVLLAGRNWENIILTFIVGPIFMLHPDYGFSRFVSIDLIVFTFLMSLSLIAGFLIAFGLHKIILGSWSR